MLYIYHYQHNFLYNDSLINLKVFCILYFQFPSLMYLIIYIWKTWRSIFPIPAYYTAMNFFDCKIRNIPGRTEKSLRKEPKAQNGIYTLFIRHMIHNNIIGIKIYCTIHLYSCVNITNVKCYNRKTNTDNDVCTMHTT